MFLLKALLSLLSVKLVLSISKHPLILVVSFDAFRHDFIARNETPTLFSISQMGTKAEYIRNIFPTKTFPNHMTIGTGVYAEDHGVLANKLFFNNRSYGYGYELFHYNDEIVPIWTLNEKAGDGRRSGSMMWPGSDFKYQNIMPSHFQPFNQSYDWNKRVDTVMSWFLDASSPANLVMLYFEEPDFIGHRYGVSNFRFKDQIRRCDTTAKYILDQLESKKLKDKVNIFLLSDHGMVSVKQDRIINLKDFVNLTSFTVTGTSPVLQLNALNSLDSDTKANLINTTYWKLKKAESTFGHFQIYTKDNIPAKFHYKYNSRVSDLLAVADLEFAFQDLTDSIEWYRTHENQTITAESEFGVHGYSNDYKEMYPFFLAHGPEIKKNFSVAPFDSVDLYPLFAHILKLALPARTPRYQIRGDIDHVSSMLVSSASFGLSTLTIGMVNIIFILIFALFVLYIS